MSAFNSIRRFGSIFAGILWLAGAFPALADGVEAELPGVEVVERSSGNAVTFALRNSQLSELTVSLDFNVVNLASSVRLPVELVLPAKCTTPPLVVLRPIESRKPWHYSWHSDFSWGSPNVHQASDQQYLLPFTPGTSFRIAQGQDGSFSHTGEDRFAVDFSMPEGTAVLAARDGIVVLVRDGFDPGAPDPAFKKRANLVFVRHSDGTLGEYVHLLKGAMSVRAGQAVRAGQLLALSGNSGYSRGPHLHFMVFRARDSKTRESLPIHFLAKEGSNLVLEQNKSYTAVSAASEKVAAKP